MTKKSKSTASTFWKRKKKWRILWKVQKFQLQKCWILIYNNISGVFLLSSKKLSRQKNFRRKVYVLSEASNESVEIPNLRTNFPALTHCQKPGILSSSKNWNYNSSLRKTNLVSTKIQGTWNIHTQPNPSPIIVKSRKILTLRAQINTFLRNSQGSSVYTLYSFWIRNLSVRNWGSDFGIFIVQVS